MKELQHAPTQTRVVSVAAFAAMVLAAFYMSVQIADEALHNSDILYAPSFIGDLWTGFTVTGWALTPAPYFLPDLFLYGLVDALLRMFSLSAADRIDIGLRLVAVIINVGCGVLFVSLLRRVVLIRKELLYLSWAVITFLFTIIPVIGQIFLSAHILTNHAGILLMWFGFWIFWLSESPVRYLALLVLVVSLISDGQSVPLLVLPSMTMSFVGLFKKKVRWHSLVDLILVALTWYTSVRLLVRIRYQLVYYPIVGNDQVLDRLMSVDHLWLQFITGMATDSGVLLSLGIIFFLCVSILISLRSPIVINDRRPLIVSFLASIFGVGMALLLHIALTMGIDDAEEIPIRYLHFITIIPLPFAVVLLMARIDSRFDIAALFRQLNRLGLWLVLGVEVAGCILIMCSMAGRGSHSQAMKEVDCVLSMFASEGIQSNETVYGVSDYWQAKRMSVFSDGRMRLLPVTAAMPDKLYFWITNIAWFDRPVKYQFAVLTSLKADLFEETYGPPKIRQSCAGIELWWYGQSSPIVHRPADIQKFAESIAVPYRPGVKQN